MSASWAARVPARPGTLLRIPRANAPDTAPRPIQSTTSCRFQSPQRGLHDPVELLSFFLEVGAPRSRETVRPPPPVGGIEGAYPAAVHEPRNGRVESSRAK